MGECNSITLTMVHGCHRGTNNHFVSQPLQTPSLRYLVNKCESPTAIASWHSHWLPVLYVRQNPLPYIVFPVDFGVLVVLESHATMLTTPTVLLLMSPTRLVLSGLIDSLTLFRSAVNPDTVSALALESKLLFRQGRSTYGPCLNDLSKTFSLL